MKLCLVVLLRYVQITTIKRTSNKSTGLECIYKTKSINYASEISNTYLENGVVVHFA